MFVEPGDLQSFLSNATHKRKLLITSKLDALGNTGFNATISVFLRLTITHFMWTMTDCVNLGTHIVTSSFKPKNPKTAVSHKWEHTAQMRVNRC